MQLIISIDNISDIEQCLEVGIHDFFIDLERPKNGKVPPSCIGDIIKYRDIDPNISIFLRPDGNEILNPLYVNKLLAAEADCIFFPSAENLDQIKYLSELFATNNTGFVAMIESPMGLQALGSIVTQSNVDAIYIGLHDFSKSMGYHHPYDIISQGYLSKIAAYSHLSKKNFGFTCLSPSFSDSQIFSLVKEQAILGGNFTLAPLKILKSIVTNDLKNSVIRLKDIYEKHYCHIDTINLKPSYPSFTLTNKMGKEHD